MQSLHDTIGSPPPISFMHGGAMRTDAGSRSHMSRPWPSTAAQCRRDAAFAVDGASAPVAQWMKHRPSQRFPVGTSVRERKLRSAARAVEMLEAIHVIESLGVVHTAVRALARLARIDHMSVEA